MDQQHRTSVVTKILPKQMSESQVQRDALRPALDSVKSISAKRYGLIRNVPSAYDGLHMMIDIMTQYTKTLEKSGHGARKILRSAWRVKEKWKESTLAF